MSTPESVPSGMSMPVTQVGGRAPANLSDFEGDASFVVGDEPAHVVHGRGQVDGDTVRFHQKDVDNSGKDIRVWIVRQEGARFVAEHAAGF